MTTNEPAAPERRSGGRRGGGRVGGCFKRRKMWKIPFFITAVILIKSALVMVLWNYLIPDLFHGPVLDYGQALGLSVLAKLLLGFGKGGRGGWKNMSNEDREKLRQKLRERFAD